MTPAQQKVYDDLVLNMRRVQEELNALDPNHYVVLWNDNPLRMRDGHVSLTGGPVYSVAARVIAVGTATQWRATIAARGFISADEDVRAVTVREAIIRRKIKDAEMLQAIEDGMKGPKP